MDNPKASFLSAALRRRASVTIYTHQFNGRTGVKIVASTQTQVTGYGFVDASYVSTNAAWTQWKKVFYMKASDDKHLVDWSNIPPSILDGHNVGDIRETYRHSVRGHVEWCGEVSIGGKPAFKAGPVPAAAKRARKLPSGWRVIEGGAQ